MSAAIPAIFALLLFALGYFFYSRFISHKILKLHLEKSETPAHQFSDGVDFVPSKKGILFGHHYSSIAGAAPIVGPAVAVIWGWVPALVWVVLGTILMGAVHDFGTLYVSMKHQGKSIGQVSKEVIGKRVQALFLTVIFFLIWMVIAVFALVIANLFVSFPSAVLPVNFEIFIALVIGFLINRRNKSLLVPSLFAQALLLVMIVLGSMYPISLKPVFGDQEVMVWILFLLLYSFVASVLPVWVLLQPRDFINSHQLFLGLGGLLLGLFIVQPDIVAPAINPHPVGAPPWFPFLFITIACGAISGFHGLVSSGTTCKQVNQWKDVRPIGYGGMLGEGLLALLATLAVTAGFSSEGEWHLHYSSWNSANGLSAKINAFVLGSSRFLSGLGIPEDISATAVAVLIISFAATSLDTAARIQRYIIGELGEYWKVPVLKNRFVGSGIAVGTALLLMLLKGGGKGGLLLWPLFGATNQMLAALSLVVISVFVIQRKANSLPFLIPVFVMTVVTLMGLVINTESYIRSENYFLAFLSVVLVGIQIWIAGEGFLAIRKVKLRV